MEEVGISDSHCVYMWTVTLRSCNFSALRTLQYLRTAALIMLLQIPHKRDHTEPQNMRKIAVAPPSCPSLLTYPHTTRAARRVLYTLGRRVGCTLMASRDARSSRCHLRRFPL